MPRWTRRDVPAVINGAGSVFATDAARDWLALLEALERPASSLRAHAVALSPFFGWSAQDIVAAEADPWAWEDVHRRLHDWGAGAARPGRGRAAGDDHARRGSSRPRARRPRRRAAADRPAPSRPAPAHHRVGRATRDDRPDRVAAHARSPRPGTPPTRSAAGGWNRTPRPCRCSPSIAARVWSSRSSTCPSCGRRARASPSTSRSSSTIPRPAMPSDWTSESTDRSGASTASAIWRSSAARISGWPTWR